MNIRVLCLLACLSACAPAPSGPAGTPVRVTIHNPLGNARPDADVVIDAAAYNLARSVQVFRQTAEGWAEVPSQFDDLDGDGTPDELFVVLDLGPDEETVLEIRATEEAPAYESRATAFLAVQQGGQFAEGVYVGDSTFTPVPRLTVPPEQAQGSGYAHREGPVWESDVIGYRYYLDERALVDVYGKRRYEPLLLEAEGDPHYLLDWGMDVLLVGTSLGLGSPAIAVDTGNGFRRFDNADRQTVEVVADGPLRALLRTTYRGFDADGRTLNVVSEQEIRAGQRWTEQRLRFDGDTDGLRIVTGMVRHAAAPDLKADTTDGVFVAYTFGPQASLGDDLGLAVLIEQERNPVIVEGDSVNVVLRFRPDERTAAYRYLAAWEREPDAPADEAAFVAMIHDVARRWSHPIRVTSH